MKYNIQKKVDSNTRNRIIDIFNILTEKLSNCVFNNKTDSTFINESKIILPYLPHIYLNIIKEVETFSDYLPYLYNKSTDQNQTEEIILKKKKDNSLERSDTLKIKSININSKINDFYNLYWPFLSRILLNIIVHLLYQLLYLLL